MSKEYLIDLSRKSLSGDIADIPLQAVIASSLMRIANSLEKMEKPYIDLLSSRKYFQERNEKLKERDAANKKLTSLLKEFEHNRAIIRERKKNLKEGFFNVNYLGNEVVYRNELIEFRTRNREINKEIKKLIKEAE